MKENQIAIISQDPSCADETRRLEQELASFGSATAHPSYYLVCTPNYLGLQRTHDKEDKKAKKSLPFYIDFESNKALYRSKQATARNELLARALGYRPKETASIIDATAGTGLDSFVLASLGYSVIMLERSPILFLLLRNALERARKNASMADIVNRLQLIRADAKSWLQAVVDKPDVIYLDPMFPTRKKRAAVKKEMALLQTLLGQDDDAVALLTIARRTAKKRVVVKRPRLAECIGNMTPSYTLSGKSCRFDIYLVSTHGNNTNSF